MKLLLLFFLISFYALFAQHEDKASVDSTTFAADTLEIASPEEFFADTLAAEDTLQIPKQIDTLYLFNIKPFFGYSSFINRKTFLKLDYRYAADYLKPFSFYFLKDQGFIGQPNEVLLYGSGFNSISFFEDGIFYSNRQHNALDLNLIQSENIDSVEIIPLPRGFLFGQINNYVSVNFLSRDFIPREPYSRIKYYEGPYGEAMIDAYFNSFIVKKLLVTAEVTNRKVDQRYYNSSFSIWQAKVKLKYLAAETFNIAGSYSFVNYEAGLNGGVNVDSIARFGLNFNEVMYDVRSAPVYSLTEIKNAKQHNFGVRLLSNPLDSYFLDANLYYKFYLDEISNEDGIEKEAIKEKSKIYGAAIKQSLAHDFFNVTVNGTIDHASNKNFNDMIDNYSETVFDVTNASASASLSTYLLDSVFVPSVFYKYSYHQNSNLPGGTTLHGIGSDIFINVNGNLNFYTGYSTFELTDVKKIVNSFELGINFKYDLFSSNLRLFRKSGSLIPEPLSVRKMSIYPLREYIDQSFWGSGIELSYKLWKILLEAQSHYYFTTDNNSDNVLIGMPKIKFLGGLYFADILFDSNLDLKAGFLFTYTGKQKYLFSESVVNSSVKTFVNIDDSFKIDFTLAGEIQKTAIVYFVWENLFDSKYFITPYYPMPERTIRFGLAWELSN
jgi:hypothetical protein